MTDSSRHGSQEGAEDAVSSFRTARVLLGRVAGFGLLPGLSILSALVLLPLVSRTDGPGGWTALALGQSFGAVISVIAGLAWPVIGGNRVAGEDSEHRVDTYILSLWTRGVILAAACISGATILFLVRPPHYVAVFFFMLGTAFNAFSATWYYSGSGSPSRLVVSEGLTRFLGYVSAIPLLLVTKDLLSYALAILVANLAAYVINWRFIVGGFSHARPSWRRIQKELRAQASGSVARIALAFGDRGARA